LVTKEVPSTPPVYTPITIVVTAPPNKGPPYFASSLSNQKMQAGQSLSFTFPAISDPDTTDTGTCSGLDYGLAGGFISGKYPTITFKPSANIVGTFTITATLTDNNLN